jgi:hypothetical protein
MNFTAKITNCVFKSPLSINTKRTQACCFGCKMDSGMDTGQYQINTVEIPVVIDLLKVLDPFQKKSIGMFRLNCKNFLLMDDATAKHYLTEMDPECMWEDKMKDRRTKHPEVVDPFNCLVPSIDLLFRVSWSATK